MVVVSQVSVMKPKDIQQIFDFNRWANERVLQRAARLTMKQLHAPTQNGHYSIFKTLVHLADVEWSWGEACQFGMLPQTYITAEQYPTLPKLKARWQTEMATLSEYMGGLTEKQLNGTVTYRWPQARPRKKVLWHILMHIANHSTHHRGELALLLTTAGHSPGELDFLSFVTKQQLKK